ncbi:DNA polymerase delta subunit like [Actinidia chinensis var. chinensis]|uniref:DNA polymerase delta subunit like n=1 Tax=Actinidia chinensis var. chinensis TaxID=1590841 RepID=A0A2R6QPL7_ACTCC|nr:DNA polymerase delta subunit like [Actinidia chinensis var. chinensis]
MASSTRGGRGDVKGFFRQRKKSAGIAKPKGNKSSPNHSATLGSDVVQPAALISHASLDLTDDYHENEEVLRQFDMNMAYGPCLGMTRLARWERARSLGLNPPKDVERLLREPHVRADCLWDGRI